MPYYRRRRAAGGTFFFTVVTWQRKRWLCEEISRIVLREAIKRVRDDLPFEIDAWVLLPDHLHCMWTLPGDDEDYSTRWKEIKKHVTRDIRMRKLLPWLIEYQGASRARKREARVWQRRCWEHEIRDEPDFENHLAYIHFNPVKHGLCADPTRWPYSSYHRHRAMGLEELAQAAARLKNCPDLE